ncbi:hypothetical protein, partial [Lactococcus petauri]|uniref:hypothetical protein n=1 Tax=Lactococcus petauri TaxID=1940789 RepID=UPI0021F16BF2
IEALAARLAEVEALDSVDKAHAWDAISAKNTCIAALEADAAAARKSASDNHASAEAAEAEIDRPASAALDRAILEAK